MKRAAPILAAACALWIGAADAAEVTVIGTPIDLDFGGAHRTTVGALTYRGGLKLVGNSAAFGGLSALRVSKDGMHVLAVTDRAAWFQMDLLYDTSGMLVGVEHGDLTPMLDVDGKALVPPRSDAESLALVRGAALVGFEREHRVLRFALDANGRPTAARPVIEPTPPAVARAPTNQGLEAMTTLAEGRVFAISEGYLDDGAMLGWILGAGDRPAETVHYVAAPGFNPTDATTLANGDVLVLERRFTIFDRAARIVRLRAADIRDGARLIGEEIARLLPPMQVDNFEGIDAIAAPEGGTRVFLLSDDNFGALQRTLLLQFWMP
ncbi:MAG: hypothetical protein EXQ93_06515 [Alphaproteobacteria bacterium]|nr:hypothetical protein [Alphaproteobacteria bacterium]